MKKYLEITFLLFGLAFTMTPGLLISQIIFVDSTAVPPGDGMTWNTAFNDLQDALAIAQPGDSIWVAAGTYYPTTNSSDRNATFQLKNGVSIYGGFEGTESQLNERDLEANETILSGDIGNPGDPSDNSFQVVTAGGGVSNANIDGFTITLGNANGGGINDQGAGMRVFGGASVHIENCSFLDNTAADRGAGVKVISSNVTIKNSLFQSNTALIGAGLLANTSATVNIENTIFRNNGANDSGGGVFYNFSTGQLKNCLFYNNTALIGGGAIKMDVSANLEIVNSTFTNNFAPDGGGLLISGSNALVTNSIFWGNSEEINAFVGDINATFSIIQGGYSGTGNFSANPLFTDPEGNDFTLQACSPAIDAGDNSALSPTDSLDLAGNPRFHDATGSGTAIVDMGAFEFQGNAQFPEVICLDATVNLDENGEGDILVQLLYESVEFCGTLTGLVNGEESLSLDCSQIGINVFTVQVFDNASLRDTSCIVSVTVVDQISPVLDCPAEVIVDAEEQCSVPVPDLSSEVEVTDNCSDSSEIILTQIPAQGLTLTQESITVFMIAQDGAGNSDFCSFTLTLINYGEENSLSCPDPVVVDAIPGECEANVSFVAQFTKGCDGAEVVNSYTSGGANAGSIYPLGTTTVTFELYVDGELEDECQSTVTVNDIEIPTINCPEDIVVEVDAGSCEATNPDLGAATASSSCGMVSIQINEPAEYGIGINMVTYEVTAENGLTNECTQTVTVEDNQFPTIDCPADVTFVLSGGDCELLNPDLGVASTSAICGGVSLQHDAPMAFPIGTTIVTYTATGDNGQTISCEQAVTVDGDAQVSITCPDAIEIEVSAGACEVEDLQVGEADVTGDCHGLILSNDAPSVFGIGITAVTHSVTTQGGAQLDYCEQIVEVIDNQEPTIACPDDVEVSTDEDSCEATEVDLGEPDALAVCGDIMVSNNAPASFAVGATEVTYTVTADNGNTASCTQTVTVEDNQAPEISCPVDVELLIPFGETEASVTLDEATATDNCGQPDINNDYNSGGADASGTYQVGETIVTFTATDNSENTATCVVTINIEQEDMPEPEPDTVTISGNVSSWTGLPIEDVNIIATGNHSGTYSTNEDGDYEFEVLVGSNLIVTPEKFVDWVVGVTVTDLVMIQQHILNQNLLPTPYQLIAADASNDGVISTFDIVLLQNLIVGLLDSLPNNQSKRFIDADFDFPNPSNPFSIGWPEYKAFQNVLNDKTEVDFVAVKIGDVNGDAWQSGHRYALTELKIEAYETKGVNGYHQMILRSIENTGLLGYQVEFAYDINELSFIGISTDQSVLAGINDEMFYHDEKRGVIRALWHSALEKQLRSGEELFTLHFKGVSKETTLRDHVKLNTQGTKYRSYALNNDYPFMDVVMEWKESDHSGGFALHQNHPNPFRGTTIIPFELPRDMEVELTIIDGTGRVIRTEEIEGRRGLNQHTVDLDGSPTGLLYYKINTAEWSGMKKMILVD